MTLVALMTLSGVYQGELRLESPVGKPVRFLDALNHPHRLAQASDRAAHCFELAQAVRRDLAGKAVPCGERIGVHPARILAAYEVSLEPRRVPSRTEAALAYERRLQTRDVARISMVLENGFRLSGEVGGGLKTLDVAKEGRHFVACREVRLMAPGRGATLELAWLAVNALRLEGSEEGDLWVE